MMHALKIFESIRQGRLPPTHQIPEPLLDAFATLSSMRGRCSRLSSLERVLTAFRHKEPDRVPVTPILCSAARQIRGTTFPEFALDAEKAVDAYASGFEFVGGDLIVLLYDLSVEAADFGQQTVYPDNSTPRPDYANPSVKQVEDYARLKPIDFSQAPRMQGLVSICRMTVKRATGSVVTSPQSDERTE